MGIAITSDGSRAYIANNGNSSVTVFDITLNAVIVIRPAGNLPTGVAITPILLY